MNGYSKIKSSSSNNENTHRSRSIDFSDFLPFPQPLKPSRNTKSTVIRAEEEGNQIKSEKSYSPERREPQEGGGGGGGGGGVGDDDDARGERFGVVLGRSVSVSTSSSSALGFQATMKRAFSMRRSSSVSERYCRIHDQYMALGEGFGEEIVGRSRSVKKKQKGSKILRACKRLFGL